MTPRGLMKCILAGLVMCQAVMAASPLLTELQPRGAQKGKTLTLTLAGRHHHPARLLDSADSEPKGPSVSGGTETGHSPRCLSDPRTDFGRDFQCPSFHGRRIP